MPDVAPNSLEDHGTDYKPGSDRATCPELLEAVSPALYLENPFRQTGLPVLAGAREVARRVDELKLSLELDSLALPWAFAPDRLEAYQIQNAVQKLKSPRHRLVHEIFWFWPKTYPLSGENSPDLAVTFLSAGNAAAALEIWSADLPDENCIARHNLALHHHLSALNLESQPGVDENELAQIWSEAVESWRGLAADPSFWQILQDRVQSADDAQLTLDFIQSLRGGFLSALSSINASLMLIAIGDTKPSRASLHASLITSFHRGAVDFQRRMETAAGPIIRGVESALVASRSEANPLTAPALSIAATLIENCDENLWLIESLTGRDETYVALSSRVAEAALNILVAHQRRTEDDADCLVILVYLLNMIVSPELRTRLEETYGVLRTNIVSATKAGEGENKAEYEREHALIAKVLIPRLNVVRLSDHGRIQFSTRIADWLLQLALSVHRDLDRDDLAKDALDTALKLECAESFRKKLQEQRVALERTASTDVHIERDGKTLTINDAGIAYDNVRMAFDEISGIRYTTSSLHPLVAWGSPEQAVLLDTSNFFSGASASADHRLLIASIRHHLVPRLVARLTTALHSQLTVSLGDLTLYASGMALEAASDLPTENLVPYARVQHHCDDEHLFVSDVDNPALRRSFSLSQVWNAAIMSDLIAALIKK